MLNIFVLISQFFIVVRSTTCSDELNTDHSLYLYTKEKIDKIRYFPPLDEKYKEYLYQKKSAFYITKVIILMILIFQTLWFHIFTKFHTR
ncbi:hypothetical protein NBO_464g0006 [Nosema bombycis CQ1]|uniref:Uncharacterized protein n=1 Tax=Nosema bombycis (strain CQ1 / CVCC 102059) TaxID=578461 RepID=R0M2S1_NOSB1|nr:hypothetical protein NBO_464g0006 [Nosema bombycis CQ1]|eukprot:EOB12319.1 hypothetical protein NBO_464g0006 [Nosema bombycis CQ1]